MSDPTDLSIENTPVRVFATRNYYEAQMARGALESQGIAAMVTGESLQTGVWGAAPVEEAEIEVHVDRRHEERARAVIAAALAEPVDPASWICRHCGTDVEGVFDVCWNCGEPAS
jgi:rubrerythrin